MTIWDMGNHRGWGDHMEWLRPGEVLTGHLRKPPKAGDRVLAPMRSGKIGEFEIKAVRRMMDPPDQFFADTEWVGYTAREGR